MIAAPVPICAEAPTVTWPESVVPGALEPTCWADYSVIDASKQGIFPFLMRLVLAFGLVALVGLSATVMLTL